MMRTPHIDPAFIKDVADTIRAMLGEDYDDQTFLDTLDGETDAMDLIGLLIAGRVEADALSKSMRDVAESYSQRAKRVARKKDACTAALGKILDAMDMKKVPHDLGTVSRTAPRARVNIRDESAIPTQLCKRVVDAAAVKKQLEAGEHVPGAELVHGQPGLTVRVK